MKYAPDKIISDGPLKCHQYPCLNIHAQAYKGINKSSIEIHTGFIELTIDTLKVIRRTFLLKHSGNFLYTFQRISVNTYVYTSCKEKVSIWWIAIGHVSLVWVFHHFMSVIFILKEIIVHVMHMEWWVRDMWACDNVSLNLNVNWVAVKVTFNH